MKAALVGDIHANLPALEAVLAHARELGAQAVWNVGDCLGYGPFPDEVVKRLRKEDALSTRGKFDNRVLRFKKKKAKWRENKSPERYLALKFAYDQLSKKNRKYLRFLSTELRVRAKGRRVLLTHTHADLGKGGLVPTTSRKRLRSLAQAAKADLIVCGHSHVPFACQLDDVWFINPGSVGLPGDGDPRASYALLQVDSIQVQVDHYRIEYDVERTVDALRSYDLPEAFAQMFLTGRDLAAVLAEAQ
jgi:putative phosphoesterase